jgi:ABC-type transporter Mla MlaB component
LAAPEPPARPVRPRRPVAEPDAIDLVISGPIDHADIPGLCERVRVVLVGSGARLVVCDVGALVAPDAATVDALARVQLTAGRLGGRVQLLHACGELRELLLLMGLCNVLPLCPESSLEPRGQAKERKEVRGVEEERDPGDPTR